jgi:hypothetical protein
VHCDLAMGILKDVILAEDTFEFNSWEGQGGVYLSPLSVACARAHPELRAQRQQQLS